MIAAKRSVIPLISLLLFAAAGYSQDCSVMKNGKFKYVDDPTAWFVIKGNKGTEYMENGKYYIKSILKWTSDCTYTLTMTKCTVPDFPYKPNDVMMVNITKIEDGIIYFSAEVKGEKSEGRVKKEE